MLHDRGVNTKISQIHKGSLRTAYQDLMSSFKEQLSTENTVSIYQQNLELLVTEMYRTKINLNPPLCKIFL